MTFALLFWFQAFTIYDIRSSRERRVIGGTVVKLFGTNGTAQEGEFTLKVAEGATGDAVVSNEHLVGTKTEISRLEKLEQMKTNGEVPHLYIGIGLTLKRSSYTTVGPFDRKCCQFG